ncbi:MAG: ABC transporter permease, partial [Burkholderiaceae bacterium]
MNAVTESSPHRRPSPIAEDRSAPAPAVRRSRWALFLWPPLIVAGVLLLMPQAVLLWMSLHGSLGQGVQAETISLDNYRRVLTDSLYLGSAVVTFRVSICATLVALLMAVPTAYSLASIRSKRIASTLIVVLLVSSFVSIVIKALGLSLLIGREGLVNQALIAVGLIDTPLAMLNNEIGVAIGLVQYTLPLLIMMVFSAVQTIPFSL